MLLEEMRADGVTPDEPCWNAVIHAYCANHQPGPASTLLERAPTTPHPTRRRSLSPHPTNLLQPQGQRHMLTSPPPKSKSTNVQEGGACGRTGMVAAEVLPSVNTYTPLAAAYGAAGRVDLAEKVLRRMEHIKVHPSPAAAHTRHLLRRPA